MYINCLDLTSTVNPFNVLNLQNDSSVTNTVSERWMINADISTIDNHNTADWCGWWCWNTDTGVVLLSYDDRERERERADHPRHLLWRHQQPHWLLEQNNFVLDRFVSHNNLHNLLTNDAYPV